MNEQSNKDYALSSGFAINGGEDSGAAEGWRPDGKNCGQPCSAKVLMEDWVKVRVIPSICQGHAMCLLACPEIFSIDDVDGHASVRDENVPPHLEDAVRQAERGCPEKAIELF